MNDPITTRPESLHSDGEAGKILRLVGSETVCRDASTRTEHITGAANRLDAYIARLRKLRDHYKARNQPVKAAGVESAIRVLREVM